MKKHVISVGAGIISTGLITTGSEEIKVFGTVIDTTVSAGGEDVIFSKGIASNTLVIAGGEEIVSKGGKAIHTSVTTFGLQYISSGGTATSTTVSSDGAPLVFDGSALRAVISNGGQQFQRTRILAMGPRSFTPEAPCPDWFWPPEPLKLVTSDGKGGTFIKFQPGM